MIFGKLFWALISLFNPFRGPVDTDPPIPYESTIYGPQSWEEAFRASEALQGEHDDIRYVDEPSGAGIKNTVYRWPGYPGKGIIPYVMSPEVQKDKKLVGLIKNAVKIYKEKTCIEFVERKNENYYVIIKKDGSKCYSNVGKVPAKYQPQTLSLGDGCVYIGTVEHELAHAVGLYHEHQRSDRDKYITVNENNVAAGHIKNFNKTLVALEEFFGANYDYDSIMHYGGCSFSKAGRKCRTDGIQQTMVPKDKSKHLKDPFEKPGLTDQDISLIKKLYKCK